MKKWKTGLVAAAILASLSVAGYANAYGGYGHGYGPGSGGCYYYAQEEMTDKERAEFNEFEQKRSVLFAEYLKGEVKAGRLTQAEADAEVTIRGSHFQKMQHGRYWNKENSQEARKARIEYQKKVNKLQIESIQKAMKNGTMSQERGQRLIERLEDWNDDVDRDDDRYYRGPRGHRGGGYGHHRGW